MYFRILHDECTGEVSYLLVDLRGRDLPLRLAAPIVQGNAAPCVHNVAHGDMLPFGNEVIGVLATPGHTASCLIYLARPAVLWWFAGRRCLPPPADARGARAVSTVLEQWRWHPLFAGLSRDEFLARVAALPVAH